MLRGRIDWVDAQLLLDELDEDHAALGARIDGLQCLAAPGPGASLHASQVWSARPSLQERLGDLAEVRDALTRLRRCSAAPGLERAFLPDAPLADYLRGVYAWLLAVVRALEELVLGPQRDTEPVGLREPPERAAGEPSGALPREWVTYRARVEEAKNFHFHELEDAIHADLSLLADDLDDERPARSGKVVSIASRRGAARSEAPASREEGHLVILLDAFDVLLESARKLEARLDEANLLED